MENKDGGREIGVWYNPQKAEVLDTADRLTRAFESHGAHCRLVPLPTRGIEPAPAQAFDGCSLLCVLGGDGTLLSALDAALALDIPLLGVNLGRIGFLTEVEPNRMEEDIARLMRGEYAIERRMLLSAALPSGRTGVALNEVAVSRTGSSSGILSVEILSGDVLVDRFSGDGVIVASATGSTAYSLSAGGPIVSPGMECFVITPVCPHTLRARPVVTSPDRPITVRILGGKDEARAVLDGLQSLRFDEGASQVVIGRASRDVRFVRLRERNFFNLLRTKLSDWTH